MLTSPGFILLILICGVTWLVARPATEAVKRAEAGLSADDLKTFREQCFRKARQADMPMKFSKLATEQARASRIWLTASLAILATIVAIVFLGPGLGLFPYP